MSVGNAAAGGPVSSVGGVLVAPVGSVIPTDATTAFDPVWVPLGLVGNDGVTPGGERAIESILDWAGDEILNPQTSHTASFSFPLLDVFNVEVHKLVFGDDNVTETPADATHGNQITVTETGSELGHKMIAFDLRHVDKKVRVVLGNAKPTTVEEGAWQKGAPQMFTVTVNAHKDETGAKVMRFYDDGVTSAV